MTKIFLRLYLFLVFTFALFFAGINYLPEYLLKDTISEAISKSAGGMFYLIEEKLKKHPQSDWRDQIKKIQPRYAFPLNIYTLDENKFDAGEMEYLNAEKTIYREDDGAGVWYHRIKSTPYILSMAMNNTNTRVNELSAAGTFSLAGERYIGQPESKWKQITDDIQQRFDIPVRMLLLQDLDVPEGKVERLQSGELVGVDAREQTERYVQRIKDSKWYIQAGPISDPAILNLLDYIILTLLAVMIAVTVWVWLRPMWLGLVNLHRTVTAFGIGEFDVRADEHNKAPTHKLATTFNAMATRIKSLIKTQKDLTNAVAHELRTPLARIRFATEILTNCDEEDKQRHLSGINKDIEEMGALVDELLMYAKFDQSGPNIKKLRRSLSDWLKDFAFESCQGRGAITPVLKVIDLTKDYSAVFDAECLERALNNLLGNACRYARGSVEVHMQQDKDNYVIHIDDDGPGIPVESYERLFEPFYRLDPSRDKNTGGYGLGLAIVKQIMLWHQGSVSVSVSPLGGARFSISLPREETDEY